MARKLTAKQIAAGFGGKRRQAAAKAGRRRKASTRSAPRKRTTTRKRTSMPRKKTTRRRGRKTFNVIGTAVAANALFQLVEPYISRANKGTLDALQGGDLKPLIAALRGGTKEAVGISNLLATLGPMAAYRIAKKFASAMGVPAPRLGPVRAW